MAYRKIVTIAIIAAILSGTLWPRPQRMEPRQPEMSIKNIGLFKGKNYDGRSKPTSCFVAIEVTRDIYYKLEYQDRQIQGGLLKPGVNLVDFLVPDLFDQSGVFRYNLVLKTADTVSNRPIVIESSVSFQERESRPGSASSKHLSRISMYVGSQLVATKQKEQATRITTQHAGEPYELDYGQYNQTNGRYDDLDRAGFSPLMLVGLAIRQIQKTRQREAAKVEIASFHSLATEYLIETADGTTRKYGVALRITAAGIQRDQ